MTKIPILLVAAIVICIHCLPTYLYNDSSVRQYFNIIDVDTTMQNISYGFKVIRIFTAVLRE